MKGYCTGWLGKNEPVLTDNTDTHTKPELSFDNLISMSEMVKRRQPES